MATELFIQPNYVIALLFDYLVETRGWKNGVAKSVATTNLVNALADYPQGAAL
jgi:phosphoglucomutase